MPLLFAATLFASAFLLFWIQPLAGKMVLPLLGGTPAVWNTCMLFFQGVLLAGYAYVLASTRWLSARAQVVLHVALLACAALALPVLIGEASAGDLPPDASPAPWLLKTLLVTAGPPFFVLSASAPLLQKWFSRTESASASDPYFLYASSNAGSLAALLGFPVLLEPALALRQQSGAWAVGYCALGALVAACGVALWRSRAADAGRAEASDAPAQEITRRPEARDSARQTGEDSARRADDAARNVSADAPNVSADESNVSADAPTLARRLRWVLLAFVPSSLVLGATTYVTTDVAAVPLLWVLPLSLYLLSFVLVFARRQLLPRWLTARLLPGAAVLLVLVYLSGATEPAWFLIFFHLFFLFAAAMVCHGQLADERPDARHLAEFYLWLAVGGALGGLFNAVVAPLAFDSVAEYPLVILLASYLRPPFRRGGRNIFGLRPASKASDEAGAAKRAGEVGDEGDAKKGARRADVFDLLLPLLMGMLAAALAVVTRQLDIKEVERVALALGVPMFLLNHFFAPRPLRFALGLGAVMLASFAFAEASGRTLREERNFFGTMRVGESGDSHWLRHGSTLHGRQYADPARACEPLTYYHREGPLGSVFEAFGSKAGGGRGSVAVVGLGAGTTAAYARAGESWTFYEIDPSVAEMARDPALFTYLSACAAAPVAVVLGDARLRLRDAPEEGYGLIVLDAFSSDAVPAHLLTREAARLYLSKLAPGGVVAFHVSNRSLDLERVVGGLARDAGLAARIFADEEDKPEVGKDRSTWVVLARAEGDFGALATDPRWLPLDRRVREPELWRDDFSDIVSVLKW